MRSSLSRSRSSKTSDLLRTLRHTRSEGNADVAGRAGAGEGRGLGLGCGVCRRGGVLGVKNTVNDVEDTVGDEDIRNDNLGLIDKDITIMNNNVNILSLRSSKSTVLQRAAVSNSTVDNMVLENALKIITAKITDDRTNIGKCSVVRCKDGNVLLLDDILSNVSLGKGTDDGGEVGGDGSVGEVLGDGKDLVDDVNGTTGKVEVLLLSATKCQEKQTTYSLGHVGLSTESTVEANSIIHSNSLNDLSTSNIGVGLVGEKRLDKGRCVGNVASVVGAIEDMVLKNSTNKAGIRGDLLRNSSIVEKFLEGIVARSENGNVAKLGERSSKTRLGPDEAYKSKQPCNSECILTYRSARRGYHSWSRGHQSEKYGSELKQCQQGQETRD